MNIQIERPIEVIPEDIIEKITYICNNINMYVQSFNSQKDRILALDYVITIALDQAKARGNYQDIKRLSEIEYFINITDRSLYSFNMDVHLKVDGKWINIY